jgi:hypothetical protein
MKFSLTLLGMFLFAKLVLQNLYAQISRAQLYGCLLPRQFPRGLNQASVQAFPFIINSTCTDVY